MCRYYLLEYNLQISQQTAAILEDNNILTS